MGDLTDAELNELATNIQQRGLQHPIEILPDGMIVAGHQRWRAVKQLGWNEVAVIIRHDLAEAGEEAIVSYLIEDNLKRRQMSPLAIARAYRQLKEIARDKNYKDLRFADQKATRDQLAARLGDQYSGRTLDRWTQVLDLPHVLQVAVEAGDLPLTLAVKLPKLRPEEVEKLAERIRNGEPAKAVAKEALGRRTPNQSPEKERYQRFLQSLATETAELRRKVQDVAGTAGASRSAVTILKEARTLIGDLLKAEEATLKGAQKKRKQRTGPRSSAGHCGQLGTERID